MDNWCKFESDLLHIHMSWLSQTERKIWMVEGNKFLCFQTEWHNTIYLLLAIFSYIWSIFCKAEKKRG